MPIYEYACKSCDHRLDALQKMSDDPLLECPECGAEALKRLVSAPRFRLKGEGWYETDFKKDNQRNLAKGDGDGETKSKPDAGKKDGKKDEQERRQERREARGEHAQSGNQKKQRQSKRPVPLLFIVPAILPGSAIVKRSQ